MWVSDGDVLDYFTFGALMQQDGLKIPQPSSLPNTTECLPYVFVGNGAFALVGHY